MKYNSKTKWLPFVSYIMGDLMFPPYNRKKRNKFRSVHLINSIQKDVQ